MLLTRGCTPNCISQIHVLYGSRGPHYYLRPASSSPWSNRMLTVMANRWFHKFEKYVWDLWDAIKPIIIAHISGMWHDCDVMEIISQRWMVCDITVMSCKIDQICECCLRSLWGHPCDNCHSCGWSVRSSLCHDSVPDKWVVIEITVMSDRWFHKFELCVWFVVCYKIILSHILVVFDITTCDILEIIPQRWVTCDITVMSCKFYTYVSVLWDYYEAIPVIIVTSVSDLWDHCYVM